ncbi:MAG: flippase [Anaerolineales bacterium]
MKYRQLLQTNSLVAKMLSGGGWIITAKVVGLITSVGGNLLLTRLLSPSDVGAYFLLFSLINMVNLAGPLGLNRSVVKFLAENLARGEPGRARAFLKKVLLLGDMSILGISAGLVGLQYLPLGQYVYKSIPQGKIVIWAAVIAYLMTASTLRGEAFLGLKRYRDAILHRSMLQNSLFVVGLFALWWFKGSSTLIVVLDILLLSTVADYLLSNYKVWRWMRSPGSAKGEIHHTSWGKILKVTLPLWISTLALYVLSQSSLWLVNDFGVVYDVALFGVAMQVKRILFRSPSELVNSVLPPFFAENYAKNNVYRLNRLAQIGSVLAFVATCMFYLPFVFWGRELLSWFFGAFYKSAYLYVVILGGGELVNAWAGATALILMMTRGQRVLALITSVSALVTVMAGYVGVRFWGGIGGSMASAVGLAILNVLMVAYLRANENISSMASISTVKWVLGIFSKDVSHA